MSWLFWLSTASFLILQANAHSLSLYLCFGVMSSVPFATSLYTPGKMQLYFNQVHSFWLLRWMKRSCLHGRVYSTLLSSTVSYRIHATLWTPQPNCFFYLSSMNFYGLWSVYNELPVSTWCQSFVFFFYQLSPLCDCYTLRPLRACSCQRQWPISVCTFFQS